MCAQWWNEAKLCEWEHFLDWKGILASFCVYFWSILPKKLNLSIVRSCVHYAQRQSPDTTCEIVFWSFGGCLDLLWFWHQHWHVLLWLLQELFGHGDSGSSGAVPKSSLQKRGQVGPAFSQPVKAEEGQRGWSGASAKKKRKQKTRGLLQLGPEGACLLKKKSVELYFVQFGFIWFFLCLGLKFA